MRPSTLAEVAERLKRGEPRDTALVEFLDAFYSALDARAGRAMLEEEPVETGDVRHDALLAAVATYLAVQYVGDNPPPWARHPKRILAEPYFTTSSDAPAMREWLVHSSPAEFKRHNIYTEARPLRRKMSERVAWARRY